MGGLKGPQLGNRYLVVGQQLQEKPLELLVSPVQLVDEQHRRTVASLIDGLEQRALDEKLRAEYVDRRLIGPFAVAAPRLHQPYLQQLARMVPLVHRVVDVQTLVALQANQVGLQSRRQRPGNLRLANAGLAFQEKGTLQLERQENGDGQPPVGDVRLLPKQILHILDRVGHVQLIFSRGSGQNNAPDGQVGAQAL